MVRMVTFEAVSKVFADGNEAVKELDLDVGEGEFVVLIGRAAVKDHLSEDDNPS